MRTSFLSKLFDTIAPRQCAICGERLSPTESALCGACHLHLPLTGFEHSAADNPMARLFWGLAPVDRVAAWFFYEPQSDTGRLIHAIKYYGRPVLARQMGTIMARQMQACGFFEGIDAVVPVPLTRRRQWQRGYNQSQEIGRGIRDATGIALKTDLIRRRIFTGSQTQLNARERRHNVEEAFQLTGSHAEGLRLLLVDDIVTTGSTAAACARLLAKATGCHVSILSLGFTR